MNAPAPKLKTKKPITEIDALQKIQRVLNELDENQRKRVLAFLSV